MIDTAKQKLGGVDILVNNAGRCTPAGSLAQRQWNEEQLETKLFGFMRAIRTSIR